VRLTFIRICYTVTSGAARLADPAREEPNNSRLVAGVLTIVSGVLVLLPEVALLSVVPLQEIPSLFTYHYLSDMIGYLLIGGVAIAGGAMTLTKKNLLLGAIGATIPLGTSIYVTLEDAVILAYMPSGMMEPSNALSDVVSYFVWPLILVLSILSLIFLAKSTRRT
jgi:hypothetical protein